MVGLGQRMMGMPPKRRNRILLVTTAILVVGTLFVLAKGALFPFILSVVLAYLLFPVVRALESVMPLKKRWPGAARIVAIIVVYKGALAAFGAALAIIVPSAVRQAAEFVDALPEL